MYKNKQNHTDFANVFYKIQKHSAYIKLLIIAIVRSAWKSLKFSAEVDFYFLSAII